jgi:hypothetical protein
MKLISCVVGCFIAALGAPMHAQESRPGDTAVVVDSRDTAIAPGLRPDASTARARSLLGLQPRVAPVPAPVPGGGGLSKSEALMVVGGAALIVGAVIGGDEGTIIMVGGAVIGLIGLWRWLQ